MRFFCLKIKNKNPYRDFGQLDGLRCGLTPFGLGVSIPSPSSVWSSHVLLVFVCLSSGSFSFLSQSKNCQSLSAPVSWSQCRASGGRCLYNGIKNAWLNVGTNTEAEPQVLQSWLALECPLPCHSNHQSIKTNNWLMMRLAPVHELKSPLTQWLTFKTAGCFLLFVLPMQPLLQPKKQRHSGN